MKRIMAIAASAAIAAVSIAACSGDDGSVATGAGFPRPVLEGNHEIANTDATYYKSWNSFWQGEPAPECESLLRELIGDGIAVRDAWFPTAPTPCGAMGAVTVVVVKLAGPDDRMGDFEFAENPQDWWVVNCGVPALWRYSFR